jgi:uncharacterized protein YabN with tetrapyrrole methylase and pyrophosphatase domain
VSSNEPHRLNTRDGADPSRRGSLVVVGTGIKLVGQTTLEALACIQRAEKLFYVVTDPATEAWLRQLNPTAETLGRYYADGKPRYKTYQEMTAQITSAVSSGLNVCAAFYGHPGMFVNAAHASIRRLRRKGFSARMLPGISAEDCLLVDLDIDPGEHGCQSFEATDFLASRRKFDPTSALILWQVGVLGESSIREGMVCRPERLRVLTSVLRRQYPARHRVVLYQAAQFPACDPMIKRVPLTRLPQHTILPITTLYIPPKPSRFEDPKIMRWLMT